MSNALKTSFEANNATYSTSEVDWNVDPGFARTHISSERYAELTFRGSYYQCTQHDSKGYDFDGRVIASWGNRNIASQPLLSGERAAFYVPLRERRPSTPYRLATSIVFSFTNMLFGKHRFPQIRVEGDPETQDFAQALVKATKLPALMIRARNLGGSHGSVGLSWCFVDGRPKIVVHNPKNICVHEWVDRDEWIPSHVSEITLYSKEEFDHRKRVMVRNWYWSRRDWMQDADLVFHDVLYVNNEEPNWEVDLERSVVHRDGVCHFVWVQNIPSDEMDGEPDYDRLYEQLDMTDILFSVISRGTTVNLDPTLILRMDLDYVQRMGVRKGSDNALTVGPQGDASYLEMSGSGVSIGLDVFRENRKTVLETAQCIIPDPATIAAQGISRVALELIYAPMTGKCDVMREQYGRALERLIGDMVTVARRRMGETVTTHEEVNGVMQEVQARAEIVLPPRVEKRDKLDPVTGDVVGVEFVRVQRTPGQGGDVELRWGSYFIPTPEDQSKVVQTVALATGGKPSLSMRSGVELVTSAFGLEGDEEYKRVVDSLQQQANEQASMFADSAGFMGGRVDGDELPIGSMQRLAEKLKMSVAVNGEDAIEKDDVSTNHEDA